MISFKEQLEVDLDIFINADEFAETHNINGQDVICVLEGLTTKEQITKANGTPAFDGISALTRVLHISVSVREVERTKQSMQQNLQWNRRFLRQRLQVRQILL